MIYAWVAFDTSVQHRSLCKYAWLHTFTHTLLFETCTTTPSSSHGLAPSIGRLTRPNPIYAMQHSALIATERLFLFCWSPSWQDEDEPKKQTVLFWSGSHKLLLYYCIYYWGFSSNTLWANMYWLFCKLLIILISKKGIVVNFRRPNWGYLYLCLINMKGLILWNLKY